MEGSSHPKPSLDSLMTTVLPALDVTLNTPPTNKKKFKRVRNRQEADSASLSTTQPAEQAEHKKNNVQLNKKQQPISSDMAAAAAAVFNHPTMDTTPAPTQHPNNHRSGQKTRGTFVNKRKGNWQDRSNRSASVASEASEISSIGTADSSEHIKGNKRHRNDGKEQRWRPKGRTRKGVYPDSRADLVGVSQEDDFSTLLLKHVEHKNKMLQRDLEEQSRKLLEEQKKQVELLNAQTAVLMNPTLLSQNQTTSSPTPNSESIANPAQQPRTTPFIPRKHCVHFLKGRCGMAEKCTFKHDIEYRDEQNALKAQQAPLRPPPPPPVIPVDPEEARRARGVCKYAKSGSCIKGNLCLFTHDMSEEPCSFYHLQGVCERGDQCRFGHKPIADRQLQLLRESFKPKSRDTSIDSTDVAIVNTTLSPAETSYGTQDLSLIGT
ncbi:hypothetical protein BG011_007889 [Mortierella polycephala]|uniref:C3H1-type domain-containing protein n=1 Tax=Mortierella polycephala TaxID=41804 RepID=A0A9P6PS83_9FUNG|nr:hypothetical protein BG011_007889 [Mortierella polycephala]